MTRPQRNQGNARKHGRIEARGLSIRYEGAERDTLHGLDFTIEAGELVAVVGAVGKTTLARTFGRTPVDANQLFWTGLISTSYR